MKKLLLITILLLACFAIGVSTLWAGGAITNMGDIPAVTGTATHLVATANDPVMDNFATTSTSGSNAGISGNAVLRTGRNIHFQTYVELVDQNNVNGPLQRAWWGLTSGTVANTLSSDTPTNNFAAFRYSNCASGCANDTTFKCVVGNGTTTTVKDTGVTADAVGHYYDIVFDDTTGNIQCLVDGVVKATFANTDAVPPASTNLLQIVAIQTETTATRDIREAWMLSTSDK